MRNCQLSEENQQSRTGPWAAMREAVMGWSAQADEWLKVFTDAARFSKGKIPILFAPYFMLIWGNCIHVL